MSNQTLQKSSTRRQARTKAGRTAPPPRPATRFEGRRDGKPLIFGWGTHLTRKQKSQIQTRALYILTGIVVAAILLVFGIGWLQQNVIIPNQTIVTVNGVHLSQDTYRKQLAYDAQSAYNNVKAELKQYAQLSTKAASGDTTAATQQQILQSQIQADEGNYSQTTLSTNTVNELVEDQLIQQGIRAQFPHDAAKLQPTAAAVSAALAKFKASFPADEHYADFLSQDNLSEDDLRAAIIITLRRTLLQQYLTDHLVSPAKQVHLREIQVSSAADATKVLAKLQKDGSDASWSTLAKQDSLDADSKNAGGDKGWAFRYESSSDAVIETWAFDPSRKIGDLSGVIADAAGTYDVVQLLGIDPSRAIDATSLSNAKSGILDHWLAGEKHSATARISSPNQDMMSAARNLPTLPDLNATLPSVGSSSSSGGLP
jgi:hypothetical protein